VSGLAISNLALPYPDFKYAEIINADEFDANNAAIKRRWMKSSQVRIRRQNLEPPSSQRKTRTYHGQG
jgi:hypothetical protein